MKNTTNPNQMITVKVASKELNIHKGKIKDMIKNKEIYSENINGVFYVDIEEIRSKIKSQNQFSDKKVIFVRENDLDKLLYSLKENGIEISSTLDLR